jgi:acid phosphatase
MLFTGRVLFATFATLATLIWTAAQTQSVRGKKFQQWGVLILENVDYSEAESNPTFQRIHNKNSNRLLSQYHAVSHPSLPNYIASIAGTTFSVEDDGPPSSHSFSDPTILDLLEGKFISWKMYAEDYPGDCLDGVTMSDSDLFAVRHVPALYSKKVTMNSTRCENVVDASEFQADLDQGTLPQWWYYIPNLKNDGHDTGLAYTASYLEKEWMGRLDNETFTGDLAMVMTFDESDSDAGQNHIYAAFIGGAISAMNGSHQDSNHYDHYSLIRTVEENWDLGSLGKDDSGAAVISTGPQSTNQSETTPKALENSATTSTKSPGKEPTILKDSHFIFWWTICLMLFAVLAP